MPGKALVVDANILVRAVLGKRVREVIETTAPALVTSPPEASDALSRIRGKYVFVPTSSEEFKMRLNPPSANLLTIGVQERGDLDSKFGAKLAGSRLCTAACRWPMAALWLCRPA